VYTINVLSSSVGNFVSNIIFFFNPLQKACVNLDDNPHRRRDIIIIIINLYNIVMLYIVVESSTRALNAAAQYYDKNIYIIILCTIGILRLYIGRTRATIQRANLSGPVPDLSKI